MRNDNIYLKPDELICHLGKTLGVPLGPAITTSHSAELMAPARSGVLWVIPIESGFAPK